MSRSLIDSATLLGHLPAEVGEVVAGRGGRRARRAGCAPRRGASGARSVSWSVIAVSLGWRRRPRAAAGRASSTVWTARSSWAEDRNHASYADGGRWTPRVQHGVEERGERRRRPGAEASAKSRTGRSVKNTENMVPVAWTTCGTPAAVERLGGGGLDRVAGGGDVGVDLVGGQPQRGQPGGGRDRVPRERAGLVDRAPPAPAATSRRPGRRTPRPGSRRPSPCRTSPGRAPSPRRAPSRPHWPRRDARKPVITSSLTNSAPWRLQVSARNALKPGSGGTTPMLPGAASVIRQAIRSPCSANAFSTAARSL